MAGGEEKIWTVQNDVNETKNNFSRKYEVYIIIILISNENGV